MFKRSGTILAFGMNAIILTTLVAISNGMASPTPQQEIMELASINDQQVIVLKEIVTVETEVVKLVSDADDPRLEEARNRFLANPNDYSDEFCLAQNIYFEASIDNLAGMAAVANTVLNRVEDSSYPDSICGVIHQDNGIVLATWFVTDVNLVGTVTAKVIVFLKVKPWSRQN